MHPRFQLHGVKSTFLGILLGWILYPFFSEFGFYKKIQAKTQTETKAQLLFDSCNDGDTCKVRTTDGIQMTLRLLGVDAPEVAKQRGPKKSRHKGQVFGTESRNFLETLVKGKNMPVKLRGTDVYNRYLALVFLNDQETSDDKKSINATLIQEGYAFAYRPLSRKAEGAPSWAIDAEKEAQKNKKGLWALEIRPENPSIFRKTNK
jgi:micrococcal nuclease